MEKRALHSPDLAARNVERIAELFPQVVTESRDAEGNVTLAVDFDLLRQELSDHVVEGPQERYQLDWPGKRAAMFAANAPIAKTLRPVRAESVDFDTTRNLFIEGDNLEALKLLQESYLGKVKLIYIDPPYNTGNDGFVYPDDYSEGVEEHLARTGQVNDARERLRSNPDSNGRFHSDWLSMMYSRLKLARGLLADDGVMIVAIDDHEHGDLRLLLDQVLGSENFIANVTWQGSGKNDARYTAGGVDYMLIYARNESLLRSLDTRWKEPKPGIDEVEAVARHAWQQSGGDPAKATTIFRSGVRTIKADLEPAVFRYDQLDDQGRVFQADNITSPNPRPNLIYDLVHPGTGRAVRTPANGWRYSRETMDELVADGRILFGPDETTSPRLKRFLSDRAIASHTQPSRSHACRAPRSLMTCSAPMSSTTRRTPPSWRVGSARLPETIRTQSSWISLPGLVRLATPSWTSMRQMAGIAGTSLSSSTRRLTTPTTTPSPASHANACAVPGRRRSRRPDCWAPLSTSASGRCTLRRPTWLTRSRSLTTWCK